MFYIIHPTGKATARPMHDQPGGLAEDGGTGPGPGLLASAPHCRPALYAAPVHPGLGLTTATAASVTETLMSVIIADSAAKGIVMVTSPQWPVRLPLVNS